jgi:hypothetical protein
LTLGQVVHFYKAARIEELVQPFPGRHFALGVSFFDSLGPAPEASLPLKPLESLQFAAV